MSVVKNGLTYTLTDDAGHTLDIVFDTLKSEGKEIKAEIQKLVYDGSSTGQLSENMLSYEWSGGNGSALKELDQKITIKPDTTIHAHYDAKKNETKIYEIDKDNREHEKETHAGLILIPLTTDKGELLVQ